MAVERIRIRRDTAATWTSENPTLGLGEMGIETDAGYLRVGDGTTAWNALAGYVGQRVSIEYGKRLGELYWLDGYEAPAAWNAASPDDYHPGLCLSAIDGYSDISATNWPDLVPYLLGKLITYNAGKPGQVQAWVGTVSGSDITLPATTAVDRILAALVEDQLVHGSYTNWRTVTLSGSGNFNITAINTATRVVTVSGAPGDGSKTISFGAYRIAGSTTTARVFEVNGRTIVSAGDADGEAFAGLLRRDRMQQITGSVFAESPGNNTVRIFGGHSGALKNSITTGNTIISGGSLTSSVGTGHKLDLDSASSPGARTGDTTDPRAMIGHLYIHGRTYNI